MKLTKQQEMRAMEAYNAYWDNYLKGDVEAMASLLSSKYTQVGSAETEVFSNKKDAVKFLFDTIDQVAGKLEMRNRNVKLEKQSNFLLFHELCDLYALAEHGWIFYSKFRATTIMEEKKHSWKIIHQHSSFPDARTGDGENIAIDKIAEENRELREAVKRRTIELEQKNLELEIETALEKVRSSALAMKEPADMLDVCHVISDQLQLLGVNNIRNVQTAIINEQKSTYLNYQYFSAYNQSVIEEAEYNKHPKAREMAETMQKSTEAFFSQSFNGEELNVFRNYRKQDKQLIDPILDDANSIHFYFYSIGPGALGISTYNTPLSESDVNLVKRFRNVFELAYRRFIDIEQAIAQAKEAKIEAALEKVRASAMSMHKSDDLLNVSEILYLELYKLGFNEMRNAMINIHNDENKTFLNYDYSHEIGKSITLLNFNTHPVMEKQIMQSRIANDAFSEAVYKGKDLEDWKEFRRKYGEKDDPRIDKIKALYYYFYSIGTGTIGISTFSQINEDKLTLLKRFRNVFSLAYQRYSDIALAEAQAREAQIELALERVRARTMAMQNSNELVDTSTVLFHQLKILGIDSIRTGVATMDEVNETVEVWSTSGMSENFEKKILGVVPANVHPMFTGIFNAWKDKEAYFSYELIGEELKKYYKKLSSYLSYPLQKEYNEREIIYTFFFPEGSLNVVSYNTLTEDECNLSIRFANVFGLVYRRFLDLKLAEAQAREAKIEATLERVRSRTMGMQKSEELNEVIRVVYDQFLQLKINVDHAGFVVDYTPKGDWHFWIADEREIPSKITHPYFESVWASQFNEAKEKGADFFATNLNFEEKNKFYNELLSYVPGLSEEAKDFYLSCPGLAASTALFDSVSLYIENFSGIPYTDEENNTLMRFGKVFQQTYTRFLDLQKAEAQARESQIEAALERVRSKAMAMHTSSDISETTGVVFSELPKLGIGSLRCGVALFSKDSHRVIFYAAANALESDSLTLIGTGEMSGHPEFENQYEYWLKQKNYFVTLSDEALRSYYEALFARLSIPYTPKEHKVQKEHGYYFAFTEGMFYAWAEEPYSDEEINILNRFKAIIDLTFRRYLDLQKAEAQAREAKIEVSLERVRSKAMAMHSPNDLAETVNVFFKELKTLGIIPIRCGVGQIDEATRTTSLTTTTSSQQGESFQVIGKVKQTGHLVLDGIFDHWKLQKEYFPVLEGEDIKAYYDVMNPQIGYPDYPEGVTQYGNSFPFKEGFVFAWTENKLSEEELQIFRRFTSVLSLTYRRYMDLKEAEAQAREAKIEASLEKVRSKTMAMQSSDELADTAAVVFQQLINLGIEPNRIYITIIKDETGLCEFWITDEDGTKVSSALRANLNENHSFKKMYEGWKQNKKSITIDMYGEELQEYFRHLSKLNVPFKDGLSQKRRMQYIAYFSKGFIGVASPDETKPETIQLLERFAAVFNLTYTRFNDLKQAEAQNKIIQAENERKTKELEEARQLQLAMLPKSIPEIANLDIAVYMKTATEVGGDYYDFKVQENGVLNIGIGDATGHGLQAGTMITLMKGFFTSDVARFSPQKFLEHCNGMIRDIKLGRILMSFSHLRFNSNSLLISSAGMPPIYYHHKKNNRTEEIIIQGLPLGAMGSASFKLVAKQLSIGDTILLLTDGLPEQMNSHKVIFDYSRVLKYFDEIAENTPNDIINRLVQKANEWMDGTSQVDDITFVVIKVR